MDVNGRLTYVNPYGLDIYGLTEEDIAKGVFALDTMHPDSRELAKENISTVLQGGDDWGAEYIGISKDGKEIPIKAYSKRIMDGDTVTGLRGVVIDMTLVKDMEATLVKTANYYQTLFENTGTAMVILQKDGTIKSCNSQFEELSGCPAAEIEGKKKWTDFVDPIELARMTAYHTSREKEGHSAPNNYVFTFQTIKGEHKKCMSLSGSCPAQMNGSALSST